MGINTKNRVFNIKVKKQDKDIFFTEFNALNKIDAKHAKNHEKIFLALRDVFKRNNKTLVLVGGYSRDLLRGDIPHDLDFATDATPEEIKLILEEVADKNDKDESIVWGLGEKYGTIAAKMDNEDIEITTYRINEQYADDSRHPEMEWGKDFEEDSNRRDFTINAVGYDLINDTFIDIHGGMSDIEKRIIRAVGDPVERFKEDPLRILRAARFAAQLDYNIEEETYKAMKKCAPLIDSLSEERKRDEITKLLLTDAPEKGINILTQSYGMEYIIPEIMDMIGMEQPTQYHDKDVYNHTLKVVSNVEKDTRLRWAALLHDIGKPNTYSITDTGVIHYYNHQNEGADMAYQILKKMKFPKEDIMAITHMVRLHMYSHQLTKGLRKDGVDVNNIGGDTGISEKTIDKMINSLDYWKNINGKDVLLVSAEDIMKLGYADIMGGAPKRIPAGLRNYEKTLKLIKNARERRDNPKPKLPVNGNDLIKKFNLTPGKDLGDVIKHLNNKLMDGDLKENDPSKAYSIAKRYLIDTLGYSIIDSPLTGDDIMKTFNLKPGKTIGEIMNLLKSEVEKGTLKVNDKKKAEQIVFEWLQNK